MIVSSLGTTVYAGKELRLSSKLTSIVIFTMLTTKKELILTNKIEPLITEISIISINTSY